MSPDTRARFDAQRISERQAELNALLPATRRALSDGERQLGGYLLGRQIVGRPVEGDALDQITRANDTVMTARQTLAHGRGNVYDDVEDSHGQSTVRAEAGRRVGRAIPNDYAAELRTVAGAMTAQAGNCGDHADVATFLHAGKLREGEQVYSVGSKTVDHGWAEQRARKPNRERDLVMDPWGKGPAVFAVDGEFSQHGAKVALDHHYDHATGAAAHAEMRELQRAHGRAMRANLRKKMDDLGPDYRYSRKKIWAPTPVISRAFTQRVQQKMVEPPDAAKLAPPRAKGTRRANEPIHMEEVRMAPLRHEIRATHIARTLGASGIREVTSAAQRIGYVAADLRDYPLGSHPAQTAPNTAAETSASASASTAQSAQRRRRAPR
ncbi:MAG TPA: AVRPPHE avirulence protein [Trinickia sp.]|uniref:AVRPPHE avirulence protein n=1 Tax=Trinickia sp. TaxID=2571163 RepID=UPI002C73406C|nr:AVRPPHE avirulence protein [Trinickia sp.]HVW50431.1 AVRPPHE avirulence protein [Trinickia sp.]